MSSSGYARKRWPAPAFRSSPPGWTKVSAASPASVTVPSDANWLPRSNPARLSSPTASTAFAKRAARTCRYQQTAAAGRRVVHRWRSSVDSTGRQRRARPDLRVQPPARYHRRATRTRSDGGPHQAGKRALTQRGYWPYSVAPYISGENMTVSGGSCRRLKSNKGSSP
jgi:hypothetical protein